MGVLLLHMICIPCNWSQVSCCSPDIDDATLARRRELIAIVTGWRNFPADNLPYEISALETLQSCWPLVYLLMRLCETNKKSGLNVTNREVSYIFCENCKYVFVSPHLMKSSNRAIKFLHNCLKIKSCANTQRIPAFLRNIIQDRLPR